MKAFLFDPETQTVECAEVSSRTSGVERHELLPDGSRRTVLFMASGFAPTGEVIYTKKDAITVGPMFTFEKGWSVE